MRSVSRGATLKHNPRTETQDKKRWWPLIINHPGHYLAESFSSSSHPSHTHISQLQPQLIPLTLSLSFYSSDRQTFCCFDDRPFKRHHSFTGQFVTATVIRTHCISWQHRFCLGMLCMHFSEYLGLSDSLCSVHGRRAQFVWHGSYIFH